MEMLRELLSVDFLPHGHCFFWKPDVLWLHVSSDAVIALAYFSIPATLVWLTRHRKDLPFPWVFYLFGAFILGCGLTHVFGIWTLWVPIYRLDGLVKALTAMLSISTAMAIVPLVPKVLALRSPAELEVANQHLERAIAVQAEAEAKLREAHDELRISNSALSNEVERRREIEADLRRSNVELEQFGYVCSHDLQEPLRAIAGCVQILQSRYRGQLDDRADVLASHAVEGVVRMQSLINELLAYSRVGTRGDPFTSTPTEAAVRIALSSLETAIRETEADIQIEALPTLLADRTQLALLFQNLIGNALKFRSARRPEVRIGARREGDVWVFSVRDNGIGIEPQYFDRIFLIFQRLHTRSEYPGTGIGLAISKKIVDRHGGKIWLESTPGEGTTFFFTIPDRQPEVAAGERSAAHVAA